MAMGSPRGISPKQSLWWTLLFLSGVIGQLLVFVTAVTEPGEKQALLTFKASLDDPDGNLKGWTSNTDPCSEGWSGVLCEEDDYPPALRGSANSHVTELRLLNLNLGGHLVDEIGDLTALKFLDVMWNNLTGSIPASIGNLSNLYLLLLNGNHFTGVLPPEIGNLSNLNRIQIDENKISGQVPSTFMKLKNIQHLHMNNNSLNGSIPEGLGSLPKLVHILLDNNRLTGTLPADIANASSLLIIQLDNNRFSALPPEYTTIPTLLKLSLRNCSLQGSLPEFNQSRKLGVLDLSYNNFTGRMPTGALPESMTAIDLSFNPIQGAMPENIANLQSLEYLELRNTNLSGTIPVKLGTGASFTNASSNDDKVVLDFQNTRLALDPKSNLSDLQGKSTVEVWLSGSPAACPEGGPSNPLCVPHTVGQYLEEDEVQTVPSSSTSCSPCKSPAQEVPATDPSGCRCAVPLTVNIRLKSPGFVDFDNYEEGFRKWIGNGLGNYPIDQIGIASYENQPGPRIAITVLIFPAGRNFGNQSEITRLVRIFYNWLLPDSAIFGPYEVILLIPPATSSGKSSGLSGGAIAGIIIGAAIGAAVLAAVLMFCCMRKNRKRGGRRFRMSSRRPINVSGVRPFAFHEMVKATDNFSDKNELGKGGYGKVYYGTLEDGQMVAVKRADEGSNQGVREFETEIELLSRVHHRHLVSLIGYCNDEGEHFDGEQMLVYEFIPNGNLRQHLDATAKVPLDIMTRLRIALGSARGIQYLHTQANPPIFHRDIKAANILLDGKYNAKVSDFGLSKLAPTDADFEGVNLGHVSTVVKGTPGYLDPEYFQTHQLTDKSDVFSFGVVLLELISGRPPISQGKSLRRDAFAAISKGHIADIIDPRMGSFSMDILEPFAKLAIDCCRDEIDLRPSMTEVLHELEEIWKEAPWSETTSQRNIENAGSSRVFEINSQDFPSQVSNASRSSNMISPSDTRSGGANNSDLISGKNVKILPR